MHRDCLGCKGVSARPKHVGHAGWVATVSSLLADTLGQGGELWSPQGHPAGSIGAGLSRVRWCQLSSPMVPAVSLPPSAHLCPCFGCQAASCQHCLPGKCQAHSWAWWWLLTRWHPWSCHLPAPDPARAASSQPRVPLRSLGDGLRAQLNGKGWCSTPLGSETPEHQRGSW